jgi:hypothetical protein
VRPRPQASGESALEREISTLQSEAPQRSPVKERSSRGILRSGVDVKLWSQRPPSVEQVRPSHCPCCGAASSPIGEAVVLQGHGVRDRQVWGPLSVGGEPQVHVLRVRRYRCTQCRAVVTVTPAEVMHKRMYGAAVIGLALALFGLGAAVSVAGAAAGEPLEGGGRQLERPVGDAFALVRGGPARAAVAKRAGACGRGRRASGGREVRLGACGLRAAVVAADAAGGASVLRRRARCVREQRRVAAGHRSANPPYLRGCLLWAGGSR